MALGPRTLWATLGIAATSDSREIRRAYARRLKELDPAEDHEGFQALRSAYERALALASASPPATDVSTAVKAADPPGGIGNAASPDRSMPLERPPSTEARTPEPLKAVGVGEHEAKQLQDSLDRLSALARTGASSDELDKAFREVIASPALESITLRERTERWFAGFLLDAGQNGEDLFGPAIAAFGWDRANFPEHPAVAAIIARQEDLRLLKVLRASDSHFHAAWLALTRSIKPGRQILYRFSFGLFEEVRTLLATIEREHPALLDRCDVQALAWWRSVLREPGFGPAFAWSTVGIIWIGTIGLSTSRVLGPLTILSLVEAFGLSLAIAPAISTTVLIGLVRPRARWRRNHAAAKPLWQACGWAGFVPLLAAGGSLPSSGAALAGLALLTVAGAGWAWIVADPDPRTRRWLRLYIVPIPITPALARGLATLPIFIVNLDGEPRAPAALSALAIIGLQAIAGGSLQNAWRWRTSPGLRANLLLVLIALTAVTPFGLWWLGGAGSLARLGVGWVQVMYLASLAIYPDLPGQLLAARRATLWGGWILYGVLSAEISHAGQGQAGLLAMGVWLLAVVAISAIGRLRMDRSALRARLPALAPV